MNVSQKCQYALRALLELAQRGDSQPVPSTAIAESRSIPVRFLETILNELKQAGWVRSRRGVRGGYVLSVGLESLSVGDVVRLIDGPLMPRNLQPSKGTDGTPNVFHAVWVQAHDAIAEVLDAATFDQLLAQEQGHATTPVFSI
jgi:Rrf2 family cysteine metabolism transcriptional repressor